MSNEPFTQSVSTANSHDLLEAEEARLILKMSPAKFEFFISTDQLRIFRANGRTCFRREDIAAIAMKRQIVQAKASKLNEKPPAAAPTSSAKTEKGQPNKCTITPRMSQGLKPKANPNIIAKANTVPKVDEEAGDKEVQESSTKPPTNGHRNLWLIAGGAAMVVVVSVMAFVITEANSKTPSVAPTSNTIAFENCKAAPGLVEAATGERPLSFGVAGKLRAVFVEEGQTVKAGSLIAELENADLVARLTSAQADLRSAEAKFGITRGNLQSDLVKAESEEARLRAELSLLEPRQEDIDQVKADVRALQADARRLDEDEQKYSDPKGRGTSWSIQLYDQARGFAEAAAAKLAAAKTRVRALEAGSRPEEKERMLAMISSAKAEVLRQKETRSYQIQSTQAFVDQVRAQVDLAKAELDKTKIMSAIDGTVVRKYMHPGEVIDALHSQPVVTVADMLSLRVRADVDEADFPHIRVGQRVKITADALEKGKYFTGSVAQISHVTGQKRFSTGEAKERMDVKIIETIVKFDSPPPARFLKLGLRVTAYFEIAK
jgi:multidrug resistance efflux pump